MSSHADDRTTGSTNPIWPQPEGPARGIGSHLSKVMMIALAIALLIFLISQIRVD